MSSEKKAWDLTSTHSLEGAAEWVRKKSGALLVMVIRPEDAAFALDPAVRASDAMGMIEAAAPEMEASVRRQLVATGQGSWSRK